jgi:hypothetical protein
MALRRAVLLASATAFLLSSQAHAACRQADAVYTDQEAQSELAFSAIVDAPALTNRFTLKLGDMALDGIVMWTADPLRPDGMLMLDCPEGDVTGQEIEACTLWRGVIYASDAAGRLGLLPEEKAEAAAALVFPDLALSLAGSGRLPDDATPPFDIFTFRECRP